MVEFAKKFFVDNTTANMLPLKECIATRISTSLVVEFMRKYSISMNSMLAFLGYGYKSRMRASSALIYDLSSRLRVLVVWMMHPSSPIGKATMIEWLLMKTVNTQFEPSIGVLRIVSKLLDKALDDRLSQVSSMI